MDSFLNKIARLLHAGHKQILEWLIAEPQNCSLHDRNDDGNTALLCATMGTLAFLLYFSIIEKEVCFLF